MPQSPSLAAATGGKRAMTLFETLVRRNEAILLLCLVMTIVFFSLASGSFFTVRNMTNVLGQASLAMIAGIGVGVIVLAGEIDISIGSIAGAAGVPLVVIMNNGGSLELGVVGALVLALMVGSINGYLAAYLGINSLIVTLGSMFVIRGFIYLYTGQKLIPDRAGPRKLLSDRQRPIVGHRALYRADRARAADRLYLHDGASAIWPPHLRGGRQPGSGAVGGVQRQVRPERTRS